MYVNHVLIIIQEESCPQKAGILKVSLFTFRECGIYLGFQDMPVNKTTIIKIISIEFSTSYPHNVDKFM